MDVYSNKLTINYSKTKSMITTKNKKTTPLNLYINNNKIEGVDSFKYLGVFNDNNLK